MPPDHQIQLTAVGADVGSAVGSSVGADVGLCPGAPAQMRPAPLSSHRLGERPLTAVGDGVG
jgi:hypothetical protein